MLSWSRSPALVLLIGLTVLAGLVPLVAEKGRRPDAAAHHAAAGPALPRIGRVGAREYKRARVPAPLRGGRR
jgi:hypothetical protein